MSRWYPAQLAHIVLANFLGYSRRFTDTRRDTSSLSSSVALLFDIRSSGNLSWVGRLSEGRYPKQATISLACFPQPPPPSSSRGLLTYIRVTDLSLVGYKDSRKVTLQSKHIHGTQLFTQTPSLVR
eukprot:1177170-Prorocentrum_minimum.AAC.1